MIRSLFVLEIRWTYWIGWDEVVVILVFGFYHARLREVNVVLVQRWHPYNTRPILVTLTSSPYFGT